MLSIRGCPGKQVWLDSIFCLLKRQKKNIVKLLSTILCSVYYNKLLLQNILALTSVSAEVSHF